MLYDSLMMFDYDKKQAIKKLKNWFDSLNKEKGEIFRIDPFDFSEYDYYSNGENGIDKDGTENMHHRLPSVFDLVLHNKSNERYAISITTDTFTDETLNYCDDYGVDVFYIDVYWILEQNERPSKIKCIQLN